MSKGKKRLEELAVIHLNAAGLDIGSREFFACVPPDRTDENVKVSGLSQQT